MASSKNHLSSSCSPTTCRPTNPNSRNSEIGNPTRRSFSGSPFAKPFNIVANQRPGFNPNTPVNSPADYRQRNSISKENVVVFLHHQEDRESGKDQNGKPARVRSPASSKGAQNFMSPTISAASKINASPRKKILIERNEPICTSVSFSGEKSPLVEDLDSKPEKCLNQRKEVSFDSTITFLVDEEPLKDEVCDLNVHSNANDDFNPLTETLSGERDHVNLDPIFESSPRVSCPLPSPALAPLDADPLMPSYDSKTNYLSPRPQFLHYRPNPRIELFLNKERDVQRLDDSFASESLSDSEVTEEESQSHDLQKESEDASSGDTLKEDEKKEEEEEEEGLLVSEPNPISTSEAAVEAKRVSKPRFFTRAKFNALLLVLAIACLCVSVTNSHIMDPSVVNNLSFFKLHIPPEISEFTRYIFENLAQKFQKWLCHSFSQIRNLIASFTERHKLGPLQYANLTTLLEDRLVDSYLVFDQSVPKAEVRCAKNALGPIKDVEDDIKPLVEVALPLETDEDIEIAVEKEDIDQGFEEQEENVACDNSEASVESSFPEYEVTDLKSGAVNMLPLPEVTEPGNSVVEVIQGGVETAANVAEPREPGASVAEVTEEKIETTANIVCMQSEIEQLVPIPQPPCMKSADIKPIVAENNLEGLDSNVAMENNQPSLESLGLLTTSYGLQEDISARIIVGISLLSLGLFASIAFIYMKNQATTTSNAALTVEQVPVTPKLENNLMSFPAKHTFEERPYSKNWQSEVDMAGESCPSEISSYQNGLSYSSSKKGEKCTSENQSHEKKPRKRYGRESMASSDYSVGSPSYGSFTITIYEKIHSMNGNADEEVITPVRRSNRIRNQVTST